MADSAEYKNFDANQLKHLEMVQAVVARLSGNGFLVKGWAVTVTAAIAGISVAQSNGWLALVGVVPVLMFWYLDATFLRSERAFRMHGDRVRRGEISPFDMNAVDPVAISSLSAADRARIAWPAVLRRPSLIGFYGAMLGLLVLTALVAATLGSDDATRDPDLPRELSAEVRRDVLETRDR